MQPDNNIPSNISARATTYDAGLRAYFQSIYNNMAMGLAFTGVVSFLVASSPELMHFFFGNALMRMVVIFSPMAFMFFGFTPGRIQAMNSGKLAALFYAFSACFGISFATIFFVYSGQSIARVFFITAGMFAATSVYGYTTKKDLTGMSGLLVMGVIGLMFAMIVNIFMHSPAMQFAISVIGVVVYTGLVAWDTQRLKEMYSYANGREANSKVAIMGALSMYINFIMIFQFLLNLMGGNRR